MKPVLWTICIALLLVGNALAANDAASKTDQSQVTGSGQPGPSTANQGASPDQGTSSDQGATTPDRSTTPDQGATSDKGTTSDQPANGSSTMDGSSGVRDRSPARDMPNLRDQGTPRDRGQYTDEGYTDEGMAPPSEPRANEPPPAGVERRGNLDVGRIERSIHRQGVYRNGVYTIHLPSLLANITVAGVQLPPSMVPASTVYFKDLGSNRTMVDGNLVLLQNQVNPVIDAALHSGLHVTALHSPFLWDRPRAQLLHFSGIGTTDELASAVTRVLDQVDRPGPRAWTGAPGGTMREGTTYRQEGTHEESESGTCPVNPAADVCGEEESTESNVCEGGTCTTGSDEARSPSRRGAYEDGGMDLSASGVDPRRSNLDIGPLQDILNVRPISRDGAYKFTFGRSATVHGTQIGREMGLKSEINFAGIDNRAIATGELVVPENNLQNALRALRNSNINILAIVNHMTGDNPRLIFVHFMGVGRPTDLARGFKDALSGQARTTPPRGEYRSAPPRSGAEPPSAPEY